MPVRKSIVTQCPQGEAWPVNNNAALVIADAVKIADATDAASIRPALDGINNFEATNSNITLAGFGSRPLMPVAFLEIEKREGGFKKALVIEASDILDPM